MGDVWRRQLLLARRLRSVLRIDASCHKMVSSPSTDLDGSRRVSFGVRVEVEGEGRHGLVYNPVAWTIKRIGVCVCVRVCVY